MSTQTIAFGYADNLPVDNPDALIERSVSVPDLGERDLLVRVEAVSVNPVDVKLRASAPADGFRVLGFDASGVVERVGGQVTLFGAGDEVFYAGDMSRPGTNQLLHLVDERIVGRKPVSLSHSDAASLPLTALTAWESAFDRLQIAPESEGVLLVVGASGGVGSILVQLVRARAPRVRIIATASSAEAIDWVTELGAYQTVDHRANLADQMQRLAPAGVDWLFSSHSEGQIETYAQVVAPYGHIVAIDDGPRDVEPLKPKCISWHWEFMFTAALHTPESRHQHEILDEVAALTDEGRVRSTTRTVLHPISAETLRQGHRLVESGRTIGKVVISNEPIAPDAKPAQAR
jgi:NADPH2:quinone reductase